MGCFLGCFGFSGKRRRRKPANKVLPGDHRLGSYEPLDSSVSQLSCSDKKIKGISSIKIGKKVSFNLNVQTYEPLKDDETAYRLSESDEDEMREKNGERFANRSLSTTVSEEKSTVLKRGPFPSNHRYQNCRDSYDDEDDEDDMAYIGSDLDEDDDADDEFEYDYDDENDIDDQRISQSEFLKQPNNQSVESPERNITNNHMHMQLPASTDGDPKRNARDRSQYVNSVLNPVENLTQWKAVKARTAAAPQLLRKENNGLQKEAQVPSDLKTSFNLYPFNLAPNHNQSKPLLHEIAVDASLSNWLASSNCNESKTSIINNSRSCSRQSREDIPIIAITNLKASTT
ncbi:hypothetical protein CISIN_1g019325mg [Citrus sinensis]|uniref:Uncharacterized protein n=1 Tax=Citrus sinensis TaxID=2711 RepID=A0A067ESC6_CITSI|nr:hypothetical protein CISIN_1g019325mg [Citrus sinensis]